MSLENYRFTETHEWVKMINDTEAVVGITDFAQSELGEIVFVDIDTVGEHLNKDGVFGSIEAVKTVSDLNIPVDGEVIEINDELENQPELVNNSPYEDGWLIKIRVDNPSDLGQLMTEEQYNSFCK